MWRRRAAVKLAPRWRYDAAGSHEVNMPDHTGGRGVSILSARLLVAPDACKVVSTVLVEKIWYHGHSPSCCHLGQAKRRLSKRFPMAGTSGHA